MDTTYDVRFSYLEIYNEKIQDCLSTAKDNLKVYKNEGNGLWVTDATKVPVKNSKEVHKLMQQGSRNRATAATNSNKESSRSHALIVVTIMKKMKKKGQNRTAQLYMVDLCGSEKVAKTGAEQQRLKEAQNINKSLLSLGNVIAALAEKKQHIPYRDSKITRLLQNCFGGNAYTSLILCCSSNSWNSTESLSSLRFGDRANMVHNKPKVNQTVSTVELKRMLGEANYKVHNLQKVVKDLTTNNSKLENLVQELYAALDAQNLRVFTNRYKIAIPEKAKCLFNTIGSNCFSHIFVFLRPNEIFRCRMTCKLWQKRTQDDFIWQFVVKHLTYGEVNFAGRRDHKLRDKRWDADLENKEIASWYEYFINKGMAITRSTKGNVLEKLLPEKGLGLVSRNF